MSSDASVAETQQVLERLARESSVGMREVSIVTSPGARVAGWAAKVKSLSSYNVYNVCVIEIGEPGTLPSEIGGQMQAVNLAEPFLQTGQLAEGTCVAVLKVGEKNVFYAPV